MMPSSVHIWLSRMRVIPSQIPDKPEDAHRRHGYSYPSYRLGPKLHIDRPMINSHNLFEARNNAVIHQVYQHAEHHDTEPF